MSRIEVRKLEKELKYYLYKDDYCKFVDYLKDNNISQIQNVKQINYYIDTKNLSCYKNDITVRIRKIFNDIEKYELTIKTPVNSKEKSNIKIKNEININLDKMVAEDIIDNQNFKNYYNIFRDAFNEQNIEISVDSLIITGSLQTERQFYLLDNKIEPMNIDINEYFGIKDYEIEWELDKIEEAREIIENILNNLKISYDNNIISKNGRFYKKYLNSNEV